MKKVILSLIFVFATGTTLMNANTNNIDSTLVEIDCIALAFDAEERAGEEFSYETFNAIVEACEAAQELQEAP
ncbi:hypothetical protein [Polaribacter sp. R77954]|uniref:hypothetical protein n=1 Tax=Polaribacter sp. R77954 TaxID=3093870 RepID=UPI0037C7471C